MPLPLFLPCAAGVEAFLFDEVQRVLPDANVRCERGGVALVGGAPEVMALNLELRLAQRVLAQVAQGLYRNEHDLYALTRSVDWQQWITPEHTLRIDTTAQHCPLHSLNFAALRVKDAVCDALREATGQRPNVDTEHPDLKLMLHLSAEHALLYVDTSGESLFKRGWRQDTGDAPLKETLAAAMLAAAGWRGTAQTGGALYDPCCGSGTIAIEAAQIACRIAPGLQRRFAFERLLPFFDADSRAQWQRLKSHAQTRIVPSPVPIYASDVSHRMVDFARRNAQRAGVEATIQFNGGDALERSAPVLPQELAGTLMINPPYGERITVAGKSAGPNPRVAVRQLLPEEAQRTAPDDFFTHLASHWKRAYTSHPAGWTAWVLSPDMRLPSTLRLKASRRVPLWNGPIECRLFRFDLAAGSMRKPTPTHSPSSPRA
jgi:putative N6-adenine-specific DNA methylase